jgi:subtilisin family serine protease
VGGPSRVRLRRPASEAELVRSLAVSRLSPYPGATAHPSEVRGSTAGRAQDPLDVVRLAPLMQRTSGSPEMTVALVDGPVVIDHPDLAAERIREIPGTLRGTCARSTSVACRHGTFVAGVLMARRGSRTPAICPGCTLLLRPIFAETAGNGGMPSASPEELAAAVVDAVTAGARVVNISATLARPLPKGERAIEEALTHAGRRGVLVVAAAGNEWTVGGSALVRHPRVISVVACDEHGRPVSHSNLGHSIGRRGLSAPGASITSLGPGSEPVTSTGTSAAAPFVTGAIALLWSEFPTASADQVRSAVTRAGARRRSTVVPPLLDAWAAYRTLATTGRG